jgi:succinyl-CoA synthetase beta subunit
VDQATDFAELVSEKPWLKTTQLVVKPDMLFGKRGKNDLLALNVDISAAETFIHERMNKQVVGTAHASCRACSHTLIRCAGACSDCA